MFKSLESSNAGTVVAADAAIAALPFDENGLIAAIAQQFDTGEVLMLAWMNRAALEETLATGRACYWSRSRKALWRKGETSGCVQTVKEMRLDCDGDAVLLLVDQLGGACHTGRSSCFYNRIDNEQLVVLSSPPGRHGVAR
ncbi:phosphoribosyl-AMP cyclohydrolase [Azoarcus taiwanensis]|uniref:Phosphoribosyl-AMP cyclohydrolase n=1 Tax=Azoarcus taiwanensis TaxID=666964 RepID=A0A972F584_9RHOO|nr:phosphoribosyl-AMP cyclohydrolase [Azoarcus taiwanensis]NMG01451.1 phosphoribosyl-AMP cyclohydrolase [Azoarcus taiwanensis]